MNNLLIKKSVACIALLLSACNSKQVIDYAQCSEAEQGMFSECLSGGCSASYSQDLSGSDACSVDGSGTVVSVKAGGECGFTSSGSCYVICDCPDGVSLGADISKDTSDDSSSEDSMVDSQDGFAEIISTLVQKIFEIELSIIDIHTTINNLTTNDAIINSNVSELEYSIDTRIRSIEDANRGQIDALSSQIIDLNNQLVAMNSEVNNLKIRADETGANIASLNDRFLIIENSVIDINNDLTEMYNSVGLQISTYEVDCNTNNLYLRQRVLIDYLTIDDRNCVLVDGVDADNIPIVSVVQVNTTMANDCIDYVMSGGLSCSPYYYEWLNAVEDGASAFGSNFTPIQGTGFSFRFDPIDGKIYTAGHTVSGAEGAASYAEKTYIVTVIGTESFSSPY